MRVCKELYRLTRAYEGLQGLQGSRFGAWGSRGWSGGGLEIGALASLASVHYRVLKGGRFNGGP